MRVIHSLCLAGALLAAATGAHAADLLPPPPAMEPLPVAAPVDIGGGWYLRGDVGHVTYGRPTEAPFSTVPGLPPLDNEKVRSSWSFGGGVGYKFNPWFRADLTVDHRVESEFHATSSATGYQRGYSVDKAGFESTTALVNGYVDLGTWWGFTPYIGAGIGVAHNELRDYNWQVYYLPGPVNGPSGTIPSHGKTHLAWALMAGAAVDVGNGLSLDVGYRYAHLGKAQTRLDEFGIGTKLKDLDAHEVRIGLRWSFLGASLAPSYSPPISRLN